VTNNLIFIEIYSIVFTGLFAGLFTQNIWKKTNLILWFFICSLNILFIYLFTKNEFYSKGLVFALYPFCWLFVSIIFKLLFKLTLIIFKEKFKSRTQKFVTHVILGDIKILYDKKLQEPKVIDFCFSYAHLFSLLLFMGKVNKLMFVFTK